MCQSYGARLWWFVFPRLPEFLCPPSLVFARLVKELSALFIKHLYFLQVSLAIFLVFWVDRGWLGCY